MLTDRIPRWLLIMIGVVVAGGLAGLLVALPAPSAVPLRIDAVTVSKEADGSTRLLVTGEGLHDRLESLVIPDVQVLTLEDIPVDVPAPLFQMASDGPLAVATTREQRLLALEVTAGRPTRVLGSVRLLPHLSKYGESPVSSIALVGSKVVLSRAQIGFVLVDVADPTTPRETDRMEFAGIFPDMESAEGMVYAASQTEGLLVVTIEDNRLRARRVPGNLSAWRVAIAGRRLVVASQKGDLAFYELDRQGWPRPVGTARVPHEIRDLVLTPGSLYVCNAVGQLLEYSFNSWPKPVLAGECELRGKPMRLAYSQVDRRVFCSLVSRGLAIVDVSRQGAPTLAGLLPMARMPFSLQFAGDQLVTAGMRGLRVFSREQLLQARLPREIIQPFISRMGKPRLLPWRDAVFVHDLDNLGLLSTGKGTISGREHSHQGDAPFLAIPERSGIRLHLLDNGMPSTRVIGHIPIIDKAAQPNEDNQALVKDVFWCAGRLVVLTHSSLKIFNCAADGAATLTGEFRLPSEAAAMDWLAPGFVVVNIRGQGLQLIDIRNPAAPSLAWEHVWPGHLQTVGISLDLLVDGHRLFVARGRLGVEVYDLSEPSTPTLVQRIDTPGSAGRLFLNNGLLIVCDQDRGVYVIDVRGRFGIPVGSYPLPMLANDVLHNNETLFVADAVGGVLQLPAPRRLVPGRPATNHEMVWKLPEQLPSGHYNLMMYGVEGPASFPVVLQ